MLCLDAGNVSGYDTYVPSCCHMYHCVIGVCILQDNKCQFCNTERNSTYTKRTPERSGTNCIILGLAIIVVTSMFNAQCKRYCKEVLSVLSCLVLSAHFRLLLFGGACIIAKGNCSPWCQKTKDQYPRTQSSRSTTNEPKNGEW